MLLVNPGSWDAGILTAVLLRIQILSDLTLWGWVSGFRRFENTRSLRNVSERSLKDTTLYPRGHAFLQFFRSDQPSQALIRLATGSFQTEYRGRKVKKTTYLYLAHKLKSVKMYLHFPTAFMGW